MIELNGKRFAEQSEPTDGVVGTARRFKRSVKLFNPSGDHIATLNKYGVIARATKTEDGRTWYSHAVVPEVGEYERYSARYEDVDKIAVRKEWAGDFETEHWYK